MEDDATKDCCQWANHCQGNYRQDEFFAGWFHSCLEFTTGKL